MHRKQVNREPYRSGEKALTPIEVQKLLTIVDEILPEVLFKLAIAGGIRRDDIIHVKKADVNEQDSTVSFYERKKRKIHTVFVEPSVLSSLVKLKKLYPKQEYLFHGRSESKYGQGHLSSKSAYNYLQKYLRVAGLPQKPFHALRATCVKICQSRGWSVEMTAKHIDDTVKTVQEHYATPSSAEMKQIVMEKGILG